MSGLSGANAIAVVAVAQGLLLAAGMLVCVLLFLWLKRDVEAIALRCGEREQALEQTLCRLRKELEEARAELAAAGGSVGLPHGRLDLTRRAQALRLYRQGHGIPEIASTLGLPRGEVELLMKIHRLRDAAGSVEPVAPGAPV